MPTRPRKRPASGPRTHLAIRSSHVVSPSICYQDDDPGDPKDHRAMLLELVPGRFQSTIRHPFHELWLAEFRQ